MHIARRSAVALLATAGLAAFTGVTATGALGSSAGIVLRSPMAASMPTDPILDGVQPGAQPWSMVEGSVLVRADGRLTVRLDRLVHENHGTAGAVKLITASLYCNQEATAAATTAPAVLSKAGKATIETVIAVPETCFTPVVLIHPLAIAGLYIAASA
jgi:hypothetical protein